MPARVPFTFHPPLGPPVRSQVRGNFVVAVASNSAGRTVENGEL